MTVFLLLQQALDKVALKGSLPQPAITLPAVNYTGFPFHLQRLPLMQMMPVDSDIHLSLLPLLIITTFIKDFLRELLSALDEIIRLLENLAQLLIQGSRGLQEGSLHCSG